MWKLDSDQLNNRLVSDFTFTLHYLVLLLKTLHVLMAIDILILK